ncbi:MAG: hypothetical protein KBT03_09640 [Bacteroidales bacterium]|nr:hypothetical protein [Candidatus Scybalousia scybalohippi]
MNELELVKESLMTIGHREGYSVTKNLEAIAKAKLRFFGVGDFRRCPCSPKSDRSCISETCQKEIQENGVCHCHLFERVK